MTDISDIGMSPKEWCEREYFVSKNFLDDYNEGRTPYLLEQEFLDGVIISMHQALSMLTGHVIFNRINSRHKVALNEHYDLDDIRRDPRECVGEYVGRITDIISGED